MTPPEDLRRRIPQVARLFEREAVKAAIARRGRGVVDRVVREQVARLRARWATPMRWCSCIGRNCRGMPIGSPMRWVVAAARHPRSTR